MKLRRFSGIGLRNLRARPQRTLLTAVGIVLGVGIVFGVITVTAAGGSGTFDRGVVEEIRGYDGVESAAPRLSLPASLILDQKNGPPEVESMRLFGVEP